MAMGIPLICNAGVGDTDRVVQTYQSGVVLDTLNEAVYGKLEFTHFDGNHLRLGAIDFFSLEEGVNRYAAVYADFN